jgi:hypothetical protein
MKAKFVQLAVFLATVCVVESSDFVVSCFDDECSPWLDDEGNKIEAHAAGLLQVLISYSCTVEEEAHLVVLDLPIFTRLMISRTLSC